MASARQPKSTPIIDPSLVERVRGIALSYPGVEEGMNANGTTIWRAGGKFWVRIWDDGTSLAARIGFSKEEREELLRDEPRTFFLTDHYRSGPYLLIRPAQIEDEELRAILETGWRALVPKRVSGEYDADRQSSF